MAILKFKKPNGYIVLFDDKVHKPEYLAKLKAKFEEVKDEPKKKAVKKKAGK